MLGETKKKIKIKKSIHVHFGNGLNHFLVVTPIATIGGSKSVNLLTLRSGSVKINKYQDHC